MTTKVERTSASGVLELVTDSPGTVSYEQLLEASKGLKEPLLVRGMCAETAASAWTIDRLFHLEPETVVTAEHYPDGDRRRKYERVDTTFSDLAKSMTRDPEQWFLAELDLDLTFSQVADELRRLPMLSAEAKHVLRLVFFGTNTQSATHFHVRDQAVLEHLRGKKRVVLAGPAATKELATNSAFGGRPQFSTHGPEVGQDAFECFRDLVGDKATVVDLEPGDSLFIPIHWWHWVEGVGECLSVTTFWRASVRDWGYPRPAGRAATAVALGEVARAVRSVTGRIGLGGRAN